MAKVDNNRRKIIIFSTILIFCMLLQINTLTFGYNAKFSDIENHWAKNEIIKLTDEGILSGYSDGTFRPSNNVTVAETITMMVNAGKYELVRKGDKIWPDFYIETALKEELVKKDEFDNYDRQITRYELARIVARYVDVNEVSNWRCSLKDVENSYKEEIGKLEKISIINGYEDGTYKGNNYITRAETVSMISKAINVKDELILKRKYDAKQRTDLTNYKTDNDKNKTSLKTYYEVSKNKMFIYDSGRYGNLDGYEINSQIINVKSVNEVIKNLLAENRYVAVLYIPQRVGIKQLRILFGEKEIDTLANNFIFDFTYYEDAYYELARITGEKEFSEKTFLKIELRDLIKRNSIEGDLKNELNKNRLKAALQGQFGKDENSIYEYMLEKYNDFLKDEDSENRIIEKKKIGNYFVNYYKKDGGFPQFYFEKIK